MFHINNFVEFQIFFLQVRFLGILLILKYKMICQAMMVKRYTLISYIWSLIDVLIILWLKSPLELKMIFLLKITLTFSHVLMIGSKEFRWYMWSQKVLVNWRTKSLHPCCYSSPLTRRLLKCDEMESLVNDQSSYIYVFVFWSVKLSWL